MILTREGIAAPRQASSPAEHPTNLYRYPEVYDALKAPEPQDVHALRGLFSREIGPGPWSILDPASGPGNWLRPFCGPGARVVGNDYCLPMVEYTRRTLGPLGCRVLHGDMYELEISDTFDVVLEASGVTSIVPDVPTLARLIDHWGARMAPGGIMLLLLNFREAVTPPPGLLWRREGVAIEGGNASLSYELVEDRPAEGTQLIRRCVHVDAPGYPAAIEETYPLRVWRPDEVRQVLSMLRVARLQAVLHPDNPLDAGAEPVSERYLLFRRAIPGASDSGLPATGH